MTTDPRFDGPGPEAVWRERLATGTFAIQRCTCGHHQFPPQALCTACGAAAPAFVAASGAGTVYAATTVRRRDGAHNVSIVTLAEGPRMMSRVEGDPDAVAIGMPVTARIAGTGEEAMVVFDPAEAGR
ncbi:Zn-ribbon domain-containing OB-fold protein [Acuticoccus sp. I52.16.1]|uniref:Zn-ribbon domain-containing OB-fold protein n=1 Tax=Acuticoccus sp. I52.16.1 TaxID=2928472 RepID=UPI001FD01197|nr:OB-fold domain-containing protein [Acuticoccus sp. I52.16.1]UOM32635.1 OB-fold domain-containing protein [Acuticoccus sp. I52.16.1]